MILTIDRSGLSLPNLTITGNPSGNPYWLPEEGNSEPSFDERATFADDSADVAGRLLTQSVLDLGTLPLTIYTQAPDGDTLKAQKRALEAAVRQFSYTVTLTLVGAPDTYTCIPANISWGAIDSGLLRALFAVAVVTIPVQPLGA